MDFKSRTPRARPATLLAIPVALLALAGCNTSAPYPNGSPIEGARVSANPYQPGTPAFCRQYARQTAANEYENRIDRGEDGFGASAIIEQQSRRDGARAYQRCLRRN